MTSSSDRRAYTGPALFSYGFRPFFLIAGIFAAVAIALWLLVFTGRVSLATAFAPRDWHVHEMLFGYIPAVTTGFLFTAIPNWTGRLPIRGTPLILLLGLWLAGRLAVLCSADTGWVVAMVIDCAFLFAIACAAGREVLAGKNWRNLRIVGLVAALALANLAFHIEAHLTGEADISTRAGLSVVIMMVSVIGGRIIPSFTHSWLSRRPVGEPRVIPVGRLPASIGRFDVVTLLASLAALVLWTVLPISSVTGILLIAVALLHAARLSRWAGDRTIREPLLLVLHVAYGFIALGFLLTGLAAFDSLPPSAGIHAWTIGAFGGMTLVVMTRASLGHTGRALIACWPMCVAFTLVAAAAIARICAALRPEASEALLDLTVVAWVGAFAIFAVVFCPILTLKKL